MGCGSFRRVLEGQRADPQRHRCKLLKKNQMTFVRKGRRRIRKLLSLREVYLFSTAFSTDFSAAAATPCHRVPTLTRVRRAQVPERRALGRFAEFTAEVSEAASADAARPEAPASTPRQGPRRVTESSGRTRERTRAPAQSSARAGHDWSLPELVPRVRLVPPDRAGAKHSRLVSGEVDDSARRPATGAATIQHQVGRLDE